MANQIRVNREKTSLAKETLPPNPPIEAQSSRSAFHAHREPKQYMSFLLLGLLFAALLVTAFAVRKSSQLRSKAAVAPFIDHVLLSPGIIMTTKNGPPVELSVLAYDKNWMPIWQGVGYNWGMSTSGSVGTLALNPGNDKIAVFRPLTAGVGDIFVTATNINNKGFGSIQVFVDVTPTPTPTPSPTLKPTPSPTPTPQPPTITSFTPESGNANTLVTIYGTGFKDVRRVTINDIQARLVHGRSQDTTIRAYVAKGTSTGYIKVIGTYGTAVSSAMFQVIPKILRLSPNSGQVGTNVTIFGSNFYDVTNVTFNGTSAQFSLISPTNIRATVPAGATSGKITISTPGGTASSITNFVVN